MAARYTTLALALAALVASMALGAAAQPPALDPTDPETPPGDLVVEAPSSGAIAPVNGKLLFVVFLLQELLAAAPAASAAAAAAKAAGAGVSTRYTPRCSARVAACSCWALRRSMAPGPAVAPQPGQKLTNGA